MASELCCYRAGGLGQAKYAARPAESSVERIGRYRSVWLSQWSLCVCCITPAQALSVREAIRDACRPPRSLPHDRRVTGLANVGQDSLAFLRTELRAGFSMAGGMPGDNRQDYRHEDAESDQYAKRRGEIDPHPDVDGDESAGRVAAPCRSHCAPCRQCRASDRSALGNWTRPRRKHDAVRPCLDAVTALLGRGSASSRKPAIKAPKLSYAYSAADIPRLPPNENATGDEQTTGKPRAIVPRVAEASDRIVAAAQHSDLVGIEHSEPGIRPTGRLPRADARSRWDLAPE